MRFSTLAVSLLSGLSVFKGVTASPIQPAALAKRQTVNEVVNDLKSAVADPISTLKTPGISAADAHAALQSISSAITAANAAVPGSAASAKRSLSNNNVNVERSELSERQADDLEIVGRVLAEVITDLVEAISGLADDLKGLPLIGALIIAIDGGLKTLLLGVEVVLVGVIQIVQGLLVGISGLLASLGGGLLAGLLLGL